MSKFLYFLFIVFVGVTLNSCSKRTVPSRTTATVTPSKNNTSPHVRPKPAEVKPIDTAVAIERTEKPVEKPKAKPEFPKVITVNDEAASKAVDGRLFYDVLGHRYWKNYKDGKYYLFDKSMYNNPDFKPPK
jgi:hypothetical protein